MAADMAHVLENIHTLLFSQGAEKVCENRSYLVMMTAC